VVDGGHSWAVAGDLRGKREFNGGGGDERNKTGRDRD